MDEGDKERERGGEREREGARKGERERPRIGVREGGGRERGRREAEAERLAADCHSPASRHPVDWCRQGREGRRNDGLGLRTRARGGFGACHCGPRLSTATAATAATAATTARCCDGRPATACRSVHGATPTRLPGAGRLESRRRGAAEDAADPTESCRVRARSRSQNHACG